MKPYYDDGTCTIYHADCREILPTLADNTAHLVATDPPYMRVVDAEWDDQWGTDVNAFLQWLDGILVELRRLLEPRGTVAVFAAPDMASAVEMQVRTNFAYLNHIVWRKEGPTIMARSNIESLRRFFPTTERIIIAEQLRNPDDDPWRFRGHVNHAVAAEVYETLRLRLVELRDAARLTNREVDVALGVNGMAGHYFGASQWSLPTREAWETISALLSTRNVIPPSYDELRHEFDSRRCEFDSRRREFDSATQQTKWHELERFSDVWTFPTVLSGRTGHPTEKPVALMSHMIQVMSRKHDVVLDPFMGSGTTLRAAKDLGRKAIGIELSEQYCEIAANRLAQGVFDFGADQ